ncbi:hypothetical protein AB0O07_16420 [Streptomyces sp. NPDC093085]|uniref:hypothetical protein n=1 Tax=Streptomyces sp. NPDC093085 TaxID=3155068 RepID=UPI003420FB5D
MDDDGNAEGAARSGGTPLRHLFDPDRESFAAFIAHDGRWTVRQGGPVPLWDRIEAALGWRPGVGSGG